MPRRLPAPEARRLRLPPRGDEAVGIDVDVLGPGPIESGQYTSKQFAVLADEFAVRLSVGRTGQCWDNALAESFFATIKREPLGTKPWPSRALARTAILDFIERPCCSIRAGCESEGCEAGRSGAGERGFVPPSVKPDQVDGGGCEYVCEMGLAEAAISSAAHAADRYGLVDGPSDAGSGPVACSPLACGLLGAGAFEQGQRRGTRTLVICRSVRVGVRPGLWCGREERSAIPASPGSR